MEIFQAAILGIIQGATEFLPISSSGHLIIVPAALKWQSFTNNLTFDVALHVGTALAVAFFFWNDWVRIGRAFLINFPNTKKILADFDSKFFVMLAIGSLPAAAVGVVFEDLIVVKLRDPRVVSITLIVFALILFWAEKVGARNRSLADLNFKDSIIVGIAQAISLVPGVSRSGVTITAGLFSGIERESAARFSFMLATPIIFGAGALRVKDAIEVGFKDLGAGVFLAGVITSGIVGWFAIKSLLRYVLTSDYTIFVWYRLAVGVIALLMFFR